MGYRTIGCNDRGCAANENFWTPPGFARHKAAMLAALLAACCLMPADPASAGRVIGIDIGVDRAMVRLSDAGGETQIFSLAGPDRIAVDIAGAEAGLAGGRGGPVSTVRQGQLTPDTARLVFELDRPVRLTDASYSPDGRSLTLSYRPARDDDMIGLDILNRRQIAPPAAFRAKPPQDHYSARVALKKPRKADGLPDLAGPDDPGLPIVVVDAGHGGHDPGAISPHGGTREKDVTLAVARKIRDRLVETGRVRVALTRDSDRFVVLQDRYSVARRLGADLFISIHADAAGNESASGATVYTLSEVASDREAQKLAVRENKANIINGIDLGATDNDVSSILIDLTQRETMNVSAEFARLLLREAGPKMKMRSESHRFASFVVLKAPDTPSILFETGYLTNEDDMKFLSSATGQNRIATAVTAAVQAHFARRLASR